jgi:ankyrin repeat protein
MDTVVYRKNGGRAIARRLDQRDQYEQARFSPRTPESRESSTLSPTIRVQDTSSTGMSTAGVGPGEPWTRPKPYEASFSSESFPRRSNGRPPLAPAAVSDSVLFPLGMQVPYRAKSEESKPGIWAAVKQRRSRMSLSLSGKAQLSPLSPVSPSAVLRRGRRRSDNDISRSVDLTSNPADSVPPIVRAAQEGSVREIEELLDQGADIEQPTSATRRTALAVAAHCGNDDIVAVLLQYRASLQVVDAFGMTPLHLAASRGHYRVVEQLLHDHAEIDCLTPDRMTPLRLASDEGYEEVAMLLLHRNAKVNARDRQQLTPLHAAAKAGDATMVDILVANGADVEAKDANFMAAIHYAAEAGHTPIVETLLSKKSNVECLGKASVTPLMFACASGHKEVVKLLIKKKASLKQKADGDMTALHWASYNGHAEIVDLLLQRRSAIEARTSDGRTPLHVATLSRSFATAELLVRKGASVEAQCSNMARPLHYACESGELATVQLLISSGANMEAENQVGRRPLHIAALQGSKEIAELLVSKGAFIDVRDSVGERPLCLASANGHLELVQSLLDKGAAMRSKFKDGQSHEDSPLCLAAKYGHLSVVLELLARGASVRQRDEQNWPPLRYAAFFGHPDVVEILLESGASIGGISSGSWGFNMTAERIGFANSGISEEKKQRVLELLHIAETREKAQQPNAETVPTAQAYVPQRDGVVEADDQMAVPEMPTRPPPPNPNSVAAIAALAASVSQDPPSGFHFLAPDLESGAPNSSPNAPSPYQAFSLPSHQPTVSPYQTPRHSEVSPPENLVSPPMPASPPPPPPSTIRPQAPVFSRVSSSQADMDRLRNLTCDSCTLAGKIVPDLTCATCRGAVFRFSYNQSASEQSNGVRGGERPVSVLDGGFVHEIGSSES